MNSEKQKAGAFLRLLKIMDELRENCPWYKKQTIESLRHLTLEETYELTEAILENDRLKEIRLRFLHRCAHKKSHEICQRTKARRDECWPEFPSFWRLPR